MLCPSRKAAIENSTGIVGTSVGAGVGLHQGPTVREHVVDDRRVDDARQVVVPQQPLVVQRHPLAGLPEPLRIGHRGGQRVDDRVVEADHRHVRLGHDQVLVVARVGDQRGPRPLHPGEVVTGLLGVGADPDRGADLEVQAVGLVELRRARVGRAGAVEGVQVQPGGAALHQLGRGDVVAEPDVGVVHGQVVVDELAEVGVARPGRSRSRRRRPPWRSASFLVRAGPSGEPFGPTRENRKGGAARAASGVGAGTPGSADAVTGSVWPPSRPPAC